MGLEREIIVHDAAPSYDPVPAPPLPTITAKETNAKSKYKLSYTYMHRNFM